MTTDPGSTSDGPMTTGINPPDPDDDDAALALLATGGQVDETTTGDSVDTSSSDAESGAEETSATAGNGETFPCDFPTTCNGAGTLGGVSGDTSAPPVTDTGSEPIWLQVQVSENDSGVFAAGMTVNVSLQSTGGDWDLKAYLGTPGGSSGCGGMQKVSATAGVDSVRFNWGESGALANNEEDGTFVAVEIFPKNDVCLPGSSWSLTVTGG